MCFLAWFLFVFLSSGNASAGESHKAMRPAGEGEATYTHVFVARFDLHEDSGPSGIADQGWPELQLALSNLSFNVETPIKGKVASRIFFPVTDFLYEDGAYWIDPDSPLALTPGRRYLVMIGLDDPDAPLTTLRDTVWKRLRIVDLDEDETSRKLRETLDETARKEDAAPSPRRRGGAVLYDRDEDIAAARKRIDETIRDGTLTRDALLERWGRPLVEWPAGDGLWLLYSVTTGRLQTYPPDPVKYGNADREKRFRREANALFIFRIDDGKVRALVDRTNNIITPAYMKLHPQRFKALENQ